MLKWISFISIIMQIAHAQSQEQVAVNAILKTLPAGTYFGKTVNQQTCKVDVIPAVRVDLVVTSSDCIDRDFGTIKYGCSTTFSLYNYRQSLKAFKVNQSDVHVVVKVSTGSEMPGDLALISIRTLPNAHYKSVRVADHGGFFGYPKKADLTCIISM